MAYYCLPLSVLVFYIIATASYKAECFVSFRCFDYIQARCADSYLAREAMLKYDNLIIGSFTGAIFVLPVSLKRSNIRYFRIQRPSQLWPASPFRHAES